MTCDTESAGDLRSQPELARENEKLLNAEALADLTEGVRQFQHAHLGRVSGNDVDGRAVHVSEQKHVLQFHATVRASPSLYEQWQQTSSFNISHISRPPSTALVSPSKPTIIAMIVISSMQGLCSGRWSASPTRYSAIDPGAALSLRLCLPPIERRTAPRGVHSTCPIPRGKNTRALTLTLVWEGWRALYFYFFAYYASTGMCSIHHS